MLSVCSSCVDEGCDSHELAGKDKGGVPGTEAGPTARGVGDTLLGGRLL